MPPILPMDILFEDPKVQSTKNDLLQKIKKIDQEIIKIELGILELKKKEEETKESLRKLDVEERLAPQQIQPLAQKIYAENRRKAQKAHEELDKLGPKIEFPLYNQPSDTAVYYENQRKHASFKTRLVEHLRKKKKEKEACDKHRIEAYSRSLQEWHSKVEKIESERNHNRYREYFDKVFPEMKKKRQDRERKQNQEEEMEEMRLRAVIPPPLLDQDQRRYRYIDNNGRIEDMAAEYKERQQLNVWTDAEIEIYKEKFLQYPRKFNYIASFLVRKSSMDCVQYYYQNKKKLEYLRKVKKRVP